MAYPSVIPNVCVICGGKLKPHEHAEGFCDACSCKAQTAPILAHDREAER